MDARLVPATLLAGVALAVATVAVYQRWWGLLIAVAATLAVMWVTPAGWTTRLPLALGFVGAIGLLTIPRPEGDYLISATGAGYAVLGLALVVLCFALATLPRPGKTTAGLEPDREGKANETST